MDAASNFFLFFISILDHYGAREWNLRTVAATSAITFLTIRTRIHRTYEVEWDSFIHSIISGLGSAICIYLNYYAAIPLAGFPEPIASLEECQGPLTSLHRIIPAITQGYAICDIINGFHLLSKGLGPEFLAHGLATFLVAAFFNELNASHILTPVLIMEGSTIPLGILRAKFLTPTTQVICQGIFVLLFFICRLVVFPLMLIEALPYMKGKCFPHYLYYVCFIFGLFFNCLNVFWFVKIVKKIHRKMSGKEPLSSVERE